MVSWANQHQITLIYIQPGKPTQNAYIERFNRTVKHEWLDMHIFNSIEHAQLLATKWLWTYNNEGPHSAIDGATPIMKLNAA
jgi:putative transposase